MVIHHPWFCVLFSSASLSVPIQGFLCTSKWTLLKGMKGSRTEAETHRSQLASTEPNHHGTVCQQTSQNQFSQGTYCDFCLPELPSLYPWPLRQIPRRKQWEPQHLTALSDRNGHWTYCKACRTCAWPVFGAWQTLVSALGSALLPQEQSALSSRLTGVSQTFPELSRTTVKLETPHIYL